MTLSANLKEKTLVKHQELEKLLVGKMRTLNGLDDYVLLLQLFYGYFGALEKLINPHINSTLLPDYQQRRKSVLLLADLSALGGTVPLLASGNHLPAITNTAEALGALYVMEGSTLGGQMITKMLSKQLGANQTYMMSFFEGYGEDTHRMWASFKQALDNYSNTENDEFIINSANQTFQKFSGWFQLHYSRASTPK